MLTGSEQARSTDGAPPGFEIKKGGLGSPAQAVALATLCAVLFLTFLDNTIVSVGLANIQSDLHAGVTSLQWVVNGYALTFASFMLAAGMLGDILGRKRIMLAGVGDLLRRVRGLRAGDQRRLAHRRPRHHGRRRRGQRARHAVHHPPRLPRPRDPRRRLGGVGRRLGPRPGPRAGHRRRAGRVLELAGHLLVQPGLRRRRVRAGGRLRARVGRPPGPPDRLRRVPLRRRVLGLPLLRRDPGGGVGLHRPSIVALFVVCALSGIAFVVTERGCRARCST